MKVSSRTVDLISRPTLLLYDDGSACCFVYIIAKYRDFVNISHSTCQCQSTNVVCPHNGIYDLCVFAIFSKRGFVDIVPLCCKPSICGHEHHTRLQARGTMTHGNINNTRSAVVGAS